MARSGLLLAAVLVTGTAAVAGSENRWLFYGRSCATEKQLETTKTFVDRAAAAGMNGITIGNLDDLWKQEYEQACLRKLKAYADAKGVKIVPHCWSVGYGTMIWTIPDLAETKAVKGMPYVVRGNEIVPEKGATPLRNAKLEENDPAKNTFPGWSGEHPGLSSFVDRTVTHDGHPSVRFEPAPEKDKYGHARFCQKITLTPHRRYRFSAWVRGRDIHNVFHPIRVVAVAETEKGKPAANYSVGRPFKADDLDWYPMSVSLMTGDSGVVYLYAGSWNLKNGTFWLADFSLEEIGVTELSTRASAPRRLRNPETGTVYKEGTDWKLASFKSGEEVRLERLPGGAIKPDERLAFDCFMVARAGPKSQRSTCMSDPRLYECFEKSARAIEETLHPDTWLLSLDEVMNGGTCELCRPRRTDMAHIFGECVTKMRNIIRKENPKAEVFAWSDMFDPNHNAREQVGGCRGSFVGSADLIPKDVGLMLWYGEKLEKSAPYFAERGHCFMGSICCDGKNIEETVRSWKRKLATYPELRGFMYTTWLNDYSKIDVFMKELR